ncbi:DUF389 domain-containing protein [Moraxella sp.]|uniref:DUF389 domain-containing protein n=1 Tax=Moraxella sp. TaxID=479 RepID=UPI0026DB01D2|nr:DUF389 domain-containing protein [Moraxella sp.]MDO4894151.1 DUF389 domain-containing protein [Moraxella sp.]
MNTENTSPQQEKEPISFSKLNEIFNLSYDQAHPDKIDNEIRSNVKVAGTNLWILMFAIFIASIGLNMNSTAVIIGAMLISPLMGPIVGIGYGIAVFDVRLIKIAFRNLLIFIGISLLTATLYFSITPLTTAQSELLARTQPTLWDVLIAFFGGLAGMIAMTRKEGSNVIPGVAIATALMPPLCTAGYGLSQGNWHYFFGAFYLFTINGVFIAIASLLISRLLKLPRRGLISQSHIKKQKIILIVITLLVMLPSGYLAIQLVKQELFNNKINQVIQQIEQQQETLWILQKDIDHKNNALRLIISGTGDNNDIANQIKQQLVLSGIKHTKVSVLYAGGNQESFRELYRQLQHNQNNPLPQLQTQLEKQANHIKNLENKIKQTVNNEQLLKELQIHFPTAQKIFVGKGNISQKDNDDWQITNNTFIWLELSTPIADNDKDKLYEWLKVRLNDNDSQLILQIQTP